MPLGPRSLAIVLAAVFLALGLGVLIGTALPADRLWLEQQQAILDALEKEFNSLRQQARAYQEELTALQADRDAMGRLVDALAPLAVDHRLAGETVALLVVGAPAQPDPPWPEQVNRLLARAGAGTVWWLHVPAGAPAGAGSGAQPGATKGPGGRENGNGSGGGAPALPGGLLQAVFNGDGDRLARWAGEGLLAVEGEPRPAQAVAIIQQGPVDDGFLTALGGAWQETASAPAWAAGAGAGPRLVGAHVNGTPPHSARRWQDWDIPVIPGIDGAAGQIALVLQLAGYEPPFTEADLP